MKNNSKKLILKKTRSGFDSGGSMGDEVNSIIITVTTIGAVGATIDIVQSWLEANCDVDFPSPGDGFGTGGESWVSPCPDLDGDTKPDWCGFNHLSGTAEQTGLGSHFVCSSE